jgi:hypothetical protein
VERHCPHVVAKQVEVLDGVELQDVGSDMKTIKFKANRGNCSINFRDHYKKEVVQWEEIGSRLAENFQPAQQSTPEPEAAHQTPTFELEVTHHSPTPSHTATLEVSPTNSSHLSDGDVHSSPPSYRAAPSPPSYHAESSSQVDTSEGKIFNYVMFLVSYILNYENILDLPGLNNVIYAAGETNAGLNNTQLPRICFPGCIC